MAAKEYRCPTCGKLLFVGEFVGRIETHCPRCKRIRRIDCAG